MVKAAIARHNVIMGLKHNQPVTEANYRSYMAYNYDFKYIYPIIRSYIREENFSQAFSKMNAVQITALKDNAIKQEFIKYKEIMNIMIPFYIDKINPQTMTPAQKATISSIANSYYGIATAEARHILSFYFGETFGAISTVNFYSGISFRPIVRNLATNNTDIKVHCFPNPASDKLYLNIENIEQNNEYTFLLYNALGQKVKEISNLQMNNIIDVNELSEGLYNYKIIDSSEKQLFKNTLIIIR